MDIVKERIADRIRQAMNERDLRQIDLINLCQPYCEKYGERIEKPDLSQWLSGRYAPSQSKLAILALALDVSEVWLLGYDIPKGRGNEIIGDEALTVSELELIRVARKLPTDLFQTLLEYTEYLAGKKS